MRVIRAKRQMVEIEQNAANAQLTIDWLLTLNKRQMYLYLGMGGWFLVAFPSQVLSP